MSNVLTSCYLEGYGNRICGNDIASSMVFPSKKCPTHLTKLSLQKFLAISRRIPKSPLVETCLLIVKIILLIQNICEYAEKGITYKTHKGTFMMKSIKVHCTIEPAPSNCFFFAFKSTYFVSNSCTSQCTWLDTLPRV